jgi:DNA polymerase-3 subunit gamma/tau
MGYQVLARKYRPQRFADVAGQDHVTRTLTNALTQKRIAHGYIFSGHRGIGKTTIARILAMALDCRTEVGSAERPTIEPCLKCVSCREISSGGNAEGDNQATHSFDFIEIDAASNRGIDDVRSICSQANVRPARDKYKIFLLDEAHQITDAAFNAILKTLEEPPEWAIFMMATTEPESIPQTIRSRCQHFSFHAVKFDDIVAQLRLIATREDIDADEAALALLAEAGDGSMRDALSIMDQAIASAPLVNDRAVLQVDQIRELMGSVPNTVFERLMECVSAGQSAELMELLNRLLTSGNSPSAIARQMVRYLRNCLMAKLGGENTHLLEVAQDERARAVRTAMLFTEEELTRNLQIVLRTFDELNYRQEQRFHLELGLLKLIHAQRLLPMEEILSGLAAGGGGGRAGVPGTSSNVPPVSRPSSTPAKIAPPPPSLSPFAASNQRSAELPSSLPRREISGVSAPREPQMNGNPFVPEENKILDARPEIAAPNYSLASAVETAIESSLTGTAVLELEETPAPVEIHAEPELKRPLVPAVSQFQPEAESGQDVGKDFANSTEERASLAVQQALEAGGHSTAAVILGNGRWTIEGGSVRIEVNAKATMIRITFNPAAEKLIRQGLSQAGAPTRFMIVPGDGLSSQSGASPRPVASANGSIENEARNHPLVVKAQEIFQAEICSVIDLRG